MNDKKLKPGMQFFNGKSKFTLLCICETSDTNVALLIRHCDGTFITVRNLKRYYGDYIWDWGFYSDNLSSAFNNYNQRKKDLF